MKKLFSVLILFLFTAILINGCSKSDDTPTTPGTGGNQYPNPPSSPSPTNGQLNVSGFVTTTWQCTDPDANDTLRYDVYAGTSTNPSNVVASNTLNRAADIGVSAPNTTVYWKVIAKDNHGGTTTGPVWSYKTAP